MTVEPSPSTRKEGVLMTATTLHRPQIKRAERLAARLHNGTPPIGSPEVDNDREQLARAMCEAIHDELGAITATRVALVDTLLVSHDGRIEARRAEAALVAAEHALMRYRDAVLAPHGMKPWEADQR